MAKTPPNSQQPMVYPQTGLATMPWYAWARDISPPAEGFQRKAWFDVRDYGAKSDGVTDDMAAFRLTVAALTPGSTLKASGTFRLVDELYLTKSDVAYDFTGAKFIQDISIADGSHSGAIIVGDGSNWAAIPKNVTIVGGEYYPVGTLATSYPTALFNCLAVAVGENITILHPRIFPTSSTRALSIQTDTNWGVAPYANIKKVRVYGLEVYGDGLAVDGIDITTAGATGMVSDVYIEGIVTGCKRGVHVNPSTDGYWLSGIDLDVTVKDADTVPVTLARCVDSKGRVKVLGATTAGVVFYGLDRCFYDVFVSGAGASLTTAVNWSEYPSTPKPDGVTAVSVQIEGPWAYGLAPGQDDVIFPSVRVDGAAVGITTARGYRSVWGTVITKNCTTAIDSLIRTTDYWGDVIDIGTGASPAALSAPRVLSVAGDFGIGTNTPQSLGVGVRTVDVRGTNGAGVALGTSGAQVAAMFSGAGYLVLGTQTAAYLELRTNNVARIVMGAAGELGFHGVTPIARAVLATGAGHTVDDVITALQNLGLVKQS